MCSITVLTSSPAFGYLANSQENEEGQEQNIPDVNCNRWRNSKHQSLILMVEIVTEGPEFPTTIAFLGPNDILVLEKEKAQFKE